MNIEEIVSEFEKSIDVITDVVKTTNDLKVNLLFSLENILQSHTTALRTKLLEEVESIKKPNSLAGFYTTGKPVESKDVSEIAYGMEKRGYNQALEDVKLLIKKTLQ